MDHHSVSELFGAISILASAITNFPQFLKNYKKKSGESLSLEMLWLWIVSDVLNLLGSVLQNILFTAILQALYYVVADILILMQVYYYRIYYASNKEIESMSIISESSSLITIQDEYGSVGMLDVSIPIQADPAANQENPKLKPALQETSFATVAAYSFVWVREPGAVPVLAHSPDRPEPLQQVVHRPLPHHVLLLHPQQQRLHHLVLCGVHRKGIRTGIPPVDPHLHPFPIL
ncbi:Seven transmembrane protein 1 [Smittium mucronatum]|uniref:Seven transmembrane protein 1 n=1 Tax=Smittium mucronatum TaxID=133383 RepID=A0A1R0H2L6_9FUNG|nr:Seven transmembrane protein 1 [Smittium mucronatum]